ncbi:MAG: hypothetical protein ABL907_08550 [Hyphomicrobium sp.]
MAKLISKFEFDRRAKVIVATATEVIREALAAPRFKEAVVSHAHKDQIAREALTRNPSLIGVLPSLAETDAAAAINLAITELDKLRDTDPLLFWSSHAPCRQVEAWLRRTTGRSAEEIHAEVRYAQAQTNWNSRYTAAHTLAERGENLNAIAAEIERANPGDN